MVFTNLANVCSHLQNASRARLSLTSIPMTKMHLALALAMQKQGLFSTVQVAGLKPPTPAMEVEIDPKAREVLEETLDKAPWLGLGWDAHSETPSEPLAAQRASTTPPSTTTASHTFKKTITEPIRIPGVPDNPAHRRIWLGLKYWNNEPVLKNMSLISKSKRRINAQVPELRNLVRGVKAGITRPLVSPGECMFLSTDIGIMEAREALERVRGGVLLVRTS